MDLFNKEKRQIKRQQKKIEDLVAKAEKENSIESLREALHLCLLLVPEINQSDDPVAWAEHKIGTARVADSLGKKTQQSKYIDLAVTEYEAALTVFTLEAFPERWVEIRFAISFLLFAKTLFSQSLQDAETCVAFAQETIQLMPDSGTGAHLALASGLSACYTLGGNVNHAREAAEALDHIADEEEHFPYFLFKAGTWMQAAKAERRLDFAEKSLYYAEKALDAMSRGDSPMPLLAQPAIDQAKTFIAELKGKAV